VSERGGWLLGLDTATDTIVVAAGGLDGSLIAAETFQGRYRHSQELLPAVERLMERTGHRLTDLAGVVVGTGPGAFTGLRVGLATAKTLAHELGVPVVGVPTAEALLAGEAGAAGATRGEAWLRLPSGPRDTLAVRAGGPPVVIRGGDAVPSGDTARLEVAVDLAGRADAAALARGRQALDDLPASLIRLGAARLAAGERDDPEQLLPEYGTAPRGAPAGAPEGGMAWSRDPR
jgi:tRNA threonylcarbamoyladenosine biosynthesis protein TsaB